ncbi:MAG: hypothetical protein ACYS9Y_02815, partial [Planctomycetota bacterium]
YITLSFFYQKKMRPSNVTTIMLLARVISWISLILLIGSVLLLLAGRMELAQVKPLMMITTVIWFITATMWFSTKNIS